MSFQIQTWTFRATHEINQYFGKCSVWQGTWIAMRKRGDEALSAALVHWCPHQQQFPVLFKFSRRAWYFCEYWSILWVSLKFNFFILKQTRSSVFQWLNRSFSTGCWKVILNYWNNFLFEKYCKKARNSFHLPHITQFRKNVGKISSFKIL